MSTNISTTFITCPADPQKTLGIKLPFLVMIIKNLKKYFRFLIIMTRNGMIIKNLKYFFRFEVQVL